METNRFNDAILGGIIGGAVGDALGMPFEGLSSEEIKKQHPKIECYFPGRKGTPLESLKPGQYSDDTQMICATLKSFNGMYTSEGLAQQFKALAPHIRGAGKSTYTALNKLVKGCSFKESGDLSGVGCGAITRVFPFVALRYGNDDMVACEDELVSAVQITHHNKTAVTAALITAGLMEKLISSTERYFTSHQKRLDFFSHLIDCSMNETPELKELQRNLVNVQDLLKNERSNSPYFIETRLGSKGTIMELLPSSLYFFLLNSEDYLAAVSDAIMFGGDTDSRAALTGIFSGVYLGKSKIPNYLIKGLEQHTELEKLVSDSFSSVLRRFSSVRRIRATD